jgi:RNA polymerase sigma-70 factor (ECF subfamily)
MSFSLLNGSTGVNETDEVLIRHSQKGDRIAFEELVRRTARLVFSRHYLETGNTHRSEDLAQETFLVAWRKIGHVIDPTGFRPWLLSVAHSVYIDSARLEGRKKRSALTDTSTSTRAAESLHELADDGPAPDESAQRDEARQQLLEVLRALPEEYRLPITLRYIAGADYETIGKQLGLTNGSLRGLLNRGMAQLRAAMKAAVTED